MAVDFSCTPGSHPLETAGGSGSETPNSITLVSSFGHLYGTSNPHATVAGVYDSTYIPYNDSGFDTSLAANEKGLFDFGNLNNGTYNVIVFDTGSGNAAFFSGVKVGAGIGPDSFIMPLSPSNLLKGRISDTVGYIYSNIPVYISGSPYYSMLDTLGLFTINKVPSGKYRLSAQVITDSRYGGDTLDIDTSITLSGGETRDMGMLEWK